MRSAVKLTIESRAERKDKCLDMQGMKLIMCDCAPPWHCTSPFSDFTPIAHPVFVESQRFRLWSKLRKGKKDVQPATLNERVIEVGESNAHQAPLAENVPTRENSPYPSLANRHVVESASMPNIMEIKWEKERGIIRKRGIPKGTTPAVDSVRSAKPTLSSASTTTNQTATTTTAQDKVHSTSSPVGAAVLGHQSAASLQQGKPSSMESSIKETRQLGNASLGPTTSSKEPDNSSMESQKAVVRSKRSSFLSSMVTSSPSENLFSKRGKQKLSLTNPPRPTPIKTPRNPPLTLPQLLPDLLFCITDFLDWPSVIFLKLTCKSLYQTIPIPKLPPTNEEKEKVLRVYHPTRYFDNELPYLCRSCMMWHTINTSYSSGYGSLSSSYSGSYVGTYNPSTYYQSGAGNYGGGRAKMCGRCLGLLEPGYITGCLLYLTAQFGDNVEFGQGTERGESLNVEAKRLEGGEVVRSGGN
ncbi:hypothetical protein K469DRAFT_753598 [Zopfia rhizophila CBS 207.26]|uniref:F-box domain-containing protein n=1 Tax=Zopfia rhizophila CBS 207.26 TaxID=1314779 RepID=A0A6A6DKQ3_9PEZI|nr:hypothetical protein K469DRAFT_753598 [Zopfia rhizophila CBS 207.26]